MARFRDHDPGFLSRLRRLTRQEAAQRRSKLRRPSWERRLGGGQGRWWVLFVTLVPSLTLLQPGGVNGMTRAGLEAALALIGLFLISDVERRMVALLGHWPDLMAALRLPTTNEWIARRQLGRSWGRVGLVFLALCLASTLAVAFAGVPWTAWAVAVAFAGTMTAVVVAASLWLAGTGRGGWLSGFLWCTAIGGWLGSKAFPGLTTWCFDTLNRYGEWIVLLLPTGWVIRPFHGLLVDGVRSDWLGLLPALVLVASIPAARRRLIEVCRLRDRVLLMHASQVPDDVAEEARREILSSLATPEPRPEPVLKEEILSRRFLGLEPSLGGLGWMERLVWRCWTPQERDMAALAFPAWPRWSRNYAICLALLVPAMAGSVIGQGFRVIWFVAIGIVLLGLTPVPPALGRLGASWWVGQGTVIALGMFPLGLREMVRWSLKTSRIRLLAGSPPALAVGTLIGVLEPETITVAGGFWCAVVAVLGAAGLQPFWLLESIFGSSWRQFTGAWGRLRTLTLIGLLVSWLGLAGLALAAAAFGKPLAAVILGIASLGPGPLGLAWAVRNWARGRLELVVLPEAGTG